MDYANKKEIVEFLKSNLNKVVKIYYTDFRQERGEEIGKIIEINEKFNFVEIGHPLKKIIKNEKITHIMQAGRHGVYFDNENGSILNIEFVEKDEYEEWINQYTIFHSKIISLKGYDICEENLEETYT